MEIESSHNKKFKLWASLLEAKGIKQNNLALLSGKKLILEYLRRSSHQAEVLLLPKLRKAEALNDFLREAHETLSVKLPEFTLDLELFKQLDILGTKQPLLVVNTPELKNHSFTNPTGLELILALSDPSNLGAMLRSAEAFGVNKVWLTKESASPFLPKSLRASAGSALRIPLQLSSLSIKELPQDLNILALDKRGQSLGEFKWPESAYLLLGEEGQGLPENLNATKIKISHADSVESLNATVAASIALYAWKAKHSVD